MTGENRRRHVIHVINSVHPQLFHSFQVKDRFRGRHIFHADTVSSSSTPLAPPHDFAAAVRQMLQMRKKLRASVRIRMVVVYAQAVAQFIQLPFQAQEPFRAAHPLFDREAARPAAVMPAGIPADQEKGTFPDPVPLHPLRHAGSFVKRGGDRQFVNPVKGPPEFHAHEHLAVIAPGRVVQHRIHRQPFSQRLPAAFIGQISAVAPRHGVVTGIAFKADILNLPAFGNDRVGFVVAEDERRRQHTFFFIRGTDHAGVIAPLGKNAQPSGILLFHAADRHRDIVFVFGLVSVNHIAEFAAPAGSEMHQRATKIRQEKIPIPALWSAQEPGQQIKLQHPETVRAVLDQSFRLQPNGETVRQFPEHHIHRETIRHFNPQAQPVATANRAQNRITVIIQKFPPLTGNFLVQNSKRQPRPAIAECAERGAPHRKFPDLVHNGSFSI